ncbi:MAG: putative HTH-type transcriptional regulator YybR [Candidatus Heimdallarchaeota archaeon LC_2]|nr:MAG: putative HTH-type transcriptional regulator YybR [Candidatus Heimdallarchaeota archaeon LC_2]
MDIMMQEGEFNSSEDECPLSKASLLLSSKWDLIVINNIHKNKVRFSELKEKISSRLDKPVTASSLSRILKRLEINSIVKRNVKSNSGESIEISYELTQQGKDLLPVIKQLQNWGEKYLHSNQ